MSTQTFGALLHDARSAHDLSLQEVADRAGCSPGYVHKLEADKVRTPSPRVLAGLAEALGLAYAELMRAAGYDDAATRHDAPRRAAGAVKRYSNAHIVELLEQLKRDVDEIRSTLAAKA
jgi:transcriptional regulator with XRE-family HTH domain